MQKLRHTPAGNRPHSHPGGLSPGLLPPPATAQDPAELHQTVALLRAEIEHLTAATQALRQSEESYRKLFELAPVGTAITTYAGEVLACNRQLCAMLGISHAEATSAPVSSFYADPSQRRRLLARLKQAGALDEATTRLRRKDGKILLTRIRSEQIELAGKKVLLTVVQDITQQKETEERLAGIAGILKLFATKASLDDFLGAAVALIRSRCSCKCAGIRLLEPDGRMPFVAQRGFSRAFLEKEQSLCLADDACACGRVLTGHPLPDDHDLSSPSGSLFCNDTSQCAPQLALSSRLCRVAACLEAGYTSLAHAPIHYRHEMIGSIHLADSRPGRFPRATIELIESIAPLLGEAIHRFKIEGSLQESEARFRSMFERHNAVMLLIDPQTGTLVDANPAAAAFYGYSQDQLRRMRIEQLNTLPPAAVALHRRRAIREKRNFFTFQHRLANGHTRTVEIHSSPISLQGKPLLFSIIHDVTERKLLEKQVLEISEEERRRIGHDLHDSLGGKLSGAALLSKALARRLASNRSPEVALANEVVQCINESIAETRSLARGLSPVDLRGSGLVGALSEFARETERHSGVRCRFITDAKVQLHDAFVASHLFRIAQEAISNALRHAEPLHLTLRLSAGKTGLSLEISDDGRGMPPATPAGSGLGLSTMRYRAGLIGAQLTITPANPHGTVVTCFLPRNAASKSTDHGQQKPAKLKTQSIRRR